MWIFYSRCQHTLLYGGEGCVFRGLCSRRQLIVPAVSINCHLAGSINLLPLFLALSYFSLAVETRMEIYVSFTLIKKKKKQSAETARKKKKVNSATGSCDVDGRRVIHSAFFSWEVKVPLQQGIKTEETEDQAKTKCKIIQFTL